MLCFRNFPVFKESIDRRVEGENIRKLRRKFFCLKVLKNMAKEPLVFPQFWVSLYFLLKRVKSRFSLQLFFFSQWRKNLWANPSVLWFRKVPCSKKFENKCGGREGGSIKIFLRKTFVSQCRKLS